MSKPVIRVTVGIGDFRVTAERDGMTLVILNVFEPEESITLENCRTQANAYAHSIGRVLGIAVEESPEQLTVQQT